MLLSINKAGRENEDTDHVRSNSTTYCSEKPDVRPMFNVRCSMSILLLLLLLLLCGDITDRECQATTTAAAVIAG